MPGVTDPDLLPRARKLMGLYRGGVGGERGNAGRRLSALLREHDLTLFDLDPSLPVTQDLAALDSWRESAALLARLGTDAQDDALSALVDADDLTDPEMRRLLDAVNLHRLAEVRVDGWAALDGVDPAALRQAAASITPADVLVAQGSLASRLRFAAARQLYFQTHPPRLIRTETPAQTAFVRGLIETLTGHPTLPPGPEGGVRAHLSAPQLARVRALTATFLPEADRRAAQAAREYGEALARQERD
ncbi:hypothetical protein BXU09_16970 [Deinococcus sp. LM3]|nr:hypothetical protein BXU09_16970 [Deinococcus sp. LM3]